MTSKTLAAGLCAAAVALTTGSSAFAQAAAAPPAVTHGPPIVGMCIFSGDTAFGLSTVGHNVGDRLKQLNDQTVAELTGEKNAIDADAKALDARRATLDQSALEQQASALQQRANALQRKAQLRDRELQATEQKAVQRVSQEMEPFIRQAYQAKGCSILLQRNSVIIGNPAMDVTQTVVTGLNGKFTSFNFDRERLDGPGAANGAPPIVQTPGQARPATPPRAATPPKR
jgi:Skp family chaperone for outer membrane proteins